MQRVFLLFALLTAISVVAQQTTDTILQYETHRITISQKIDSVKISKGANVSVNFSDSVKVAFVTSNMPVDSMFIYVEGKELRYYFKVLKNDFAEKNISDCSTPEEIQKMRKAKQNKTILQNILGKSLQGLEITDILGNPYRIGGEEKTFILFTSKYCLPCSMLNTQILDLKEKLYKNGVENFYVILKDSLFIKNDTVYCYLTRGFSAQPVSKYKPLIEMKKIPHFSEYQYKKIQEQVNIEVIPTGILVNNAGYVQNIIIGFTVLDDENNIKKALSRWLFLPNIRYFKG